MTYFVAIGVINDKTIKMYPKCFNGKLWPYQLSCFIDYFLYAQSVSPGFLKSYLWDEASYSFKITCILVKQVISLKKIGCVISKIYCLVSQSPLCTPLILLSALMKMSSTTTTVICNSMRAETPGKFVI